MSVVTPETWYRWFWVLYAVIALIAARVYLVNPILARLDALLRK